jgi:hypothetical protein
MSLIDPADAAIGPDSVKIGVWQRRLVLFERIAGGFMMFKGLVQWAVMLGVGDGSGSRFLDLPLETQVTTVFFGVVDIVAGVGLWLGSTWGAALWLIAAALQIVAGAGFVELSVFLLLLTIIEIVMVAVYIVTRLLAHFEDVR